MQSPAALVVEALGVLDPSLIREAFDRLKAEPAPLTRQHLKREVRLDRRLDDERRVA